MIVVRELLKRYGDVVALNGVSMVFRDDEVTALLGENGAGKTTLLKICANVIPFDDGKVEIDGIDIREDSIEDRKITGYLPEMPYLYDRLTGREFLRFVATIREIRDAEKRIESLSNKLGIHDFLDYEIGTYSKGMKQKISVIAAIIHSPKNLLLDEPVYGLDPLTSRTLQDFIRKRSGTTIIATHSTELVENIADRVHIMKRGRVVFTGALKEIVEEYGSVRDAYFSAVE
jgi:ABC-2 type transport system ATP-binding protein